MYSAYSIAVVVCGWVVSFGMRISQWSNGELVGVYVGVSGSPTCVRSVSARRSARDLRKEAGCGEGLAWRSPPRRAGVFG